jgi:hypothetical protein
MLKFCGILFKIVAGFFFYMVTLMAFMSGFPVGWKFGFLIVLAIVGTVSLVIGLAFTGFRNWKIDAGVVLLFAPCFTAFIAFSLVCFYMSEELRKLMPAELLESANSYLTGCSVIAAMALLGYMLVRGGGRKSAGVINP